MIRVYAGHKASSTVEIELPVKRWHAQPVDWRLTPTSYMAGIASDDSDDDFDGYLLSDEEPEGPEGSILLL